MTVLVTGITGYVGSLLAASLHRDGVPVRGFARHPERVALPVPVVAGDAVSGEGLDRALDGIRVAYFLIHSMERASGPFSERESTAAIRFAAAAQRAGVQRVVYLGGPEPSGGTERSQHLASRLDVERILLESAADAIALRASIVIGARSRSFRLLVRLVERLPVLAIPAWGAHRTAPIDERDILAMLRAAGDAPAGTGGRALDAAGPDVVTYRGLIERIAELMLVTRPSVGLGRLNLTPLAAPVAARLAGEDPELIRPLMESLESDLLPSGELAAGALGVRLHSLDAAVERALRDWESVEPLAAR